MTHLAQRQSEMVALFSRLRNREPLAVVAHSWFEGVTFADLALLQPAEQRAVNQFHELLGELRWYLRYTEDMPLQLEQRLGVFARRLQERHALLTAVIGTGDGKAVPAVHVHPRSPAARRLLRPRPSGKR